MSDIFEMIFWLLMLPSVMISMIIIYAAQSLSYFTHLPTAIGGYWLVWAGIWLQGYRVTDPDKFYVSVRRCCINHPEAELPQTSDGFTQQRPSGACPER